MTRWQAYTKPFRISPSTAAHQHISARAGDTVTKKTEPIRFAGSELGENRHACAFFNSDVEAYRVLLPFISDGFACGDKAIHLVNPGQCSDHLQQLASAGIDAAAAQQAGQLEVRNNAETYLRDGRFVIGGILQQNPFFVPPEQFLRERRAQQAVE
jgi:hypothetical protein